MARERIPSLPPDTESSSPASLSYYQTKKLKEKQGKLSTLRNHLHPIPFTPIVTGDVHKHERLYRALGLFTFIVLSPAASETKIRTDLIAQLIASYRSYTGSSTIAGTCIRVSRVDLARALHLPSKKGQQKIREAELELFSREDSIRALTESIGNSFVVVQEGILPQEIVAAEQLVKSGQAHKVDWAGLIWSEVKKELTETPKPGTRFNCYYASHLQCLIRHQMPKIMLQTPTGTAAEIDPELGSQAEKEHDHACISPLIEEEDGEGEEEEEAHTPERMKVGDAALDKEKKSPHARLMIILGRRRKASIMDDSRPCEVNGGEQLVSDGRNLGTEHSMQCCCTNASRSSELKDLVQEEAKGKRGKVKHREGLAAKLASCDPLLAMEVNTGSYCNTSDPYANKVHDEEALETEEEFMRMGNNVPPETEMDYQLGTSHFFQNEGKKGFLDAGEDTDCFTQGTHLSKRMRSDGHWEHEGLSVETYMQYIQILTAKEKLANDQNVDLHLQIQLLNKALHEKDALMNNLEKRMMDQQQRTELELNRYDHEVQALRCLVNGYKNALGQSRSALAAYRKRFPHGEEPLYKDIPGNEK